MLYVGLFAPEKNLPVLLHAVRRAVDQGVDVHLALVGGGPLRERLAGEAERLGVADRVTVIGPYPRGELGGVYAGADVFAFPSGVDTQAYVLNEAAHEQLALLVSDTANGVVEDGVSALVVPPDPASYAQALG
ncbi:glycosyltransferase, partial [Escherichia coli]|uniref:glycosyltransferase n=1 Tax=Escherichia coli TaxID=562 RepID=UPI0015CA5CB8